MVPSTNNPGPSLARAIAGRVVRLALGLAVAAASVAPVQAQSRIKDIADFEGVRDNMLVGYGLVVGLQGSGDRLRNAVFTQETLIGMHARLGVTTRDSALNATNTHQTMGNTLIPPSYPPAAR